MDEKLRQFVDAAGEWWSKSYGLPPMTGRVLSWLLECDPVEQTAAQLAEALDASKGSISGATGMLLRAHLVDRLHVRGERADRFRLRPEAWDEQVRDQGAAHSGALLRWGSRRWRTSWVWCSRPRRSSPPPACRESPIRSPASTRSLSSSTPHAI